MRGREVNTLTKTNAMKLALKSGVRKQLGRQIIALLIPMAALFSTSPIRGQEGQINIHNHATSILIDPRTVGPVSVAACFGGAFHWANDRVVEMIRERKKA
jgi:hypothetical protein